MCKQDEDHKGYVMDRDPIVENAKRQTKDSGILVRNHRDHMSKNEKSSICKVEF